MKIIEIKKENPIIRIPQKFFGTDKRIRKIKVYVFFSEDKIEIKKINS